jgi:hypothetical protein
MGSRVKKMAAERALERGGRVVQRWGTTAWLGGGVEIWAVGGGGRPLAVGE